METSSLALSSGNLSMQLRELGAIFLDWPHLELRNEVWKTSTLVA